MTQAHLAILHTMMQSEDMVNAIKAAFNDAANQRVNALVSAAADGDTTESCRLATQIKTFEEAHSVLERAASKYRETRDG